MATRSSLAILNSDGTVHGQYCHSGGYLSNNGVLLYQNYRDVNKVKELIALGDMSYLAENVNPSGTNHSFDRPQSGVCVFYGRDRQEEETETQKYNSLEEYMRDGNFQQYDYIFHEKKNDWYLINHDTQKLQKLTTKLKQYYEVSESVKEQITKEMEIKKQYKKINDRLPTKSTGLKSLKI